MRPPTQIDGSFTWDKDQIAWVQESTGMIVTQTYIDAMNIPITAEARANQRKAIEALRKADPAPPVDEIGWHGMTQKERVKAIISLEKNDKEDKWRIETQDADGEWQHIALSRLAPKDFNDVHLVVEEAQRLADETGVPHRVWKDWTSNIFYPSKKTDQG